MTTQTPPAVKTELFKLPYAVQQAMALTKPLHVQEGQYIRMYSGEFPDHDFIVTRPLLINAIGRKREESINRYGFNEGPLTWSTGTCRTCSFMAKHEGQPNESGVEFRAWNHEHETGHRVDIRTEVEGV